MAEKLTEQQFLTELEPVAEKFYNRHMEKSKQWYPHLLIPYSQGEDFDEEYIWEQEQSVVRDPDVRSALIVNLLTEDNLPFYFRDIDRMFSGEGAWRAWNGQWTAEEGRHSIAIRDYLTVTRAVDPKALEDARMVQVSKGEVPQPHTARMGMIYVTLQELATRVAHRNTGSKLSDVDTIGKKIMDRVGNDENFHFLFYRDVATESIQLDPSGFVQDVEEIVTNFEMPGTGIPNFTRHAARIALSGVYGQTEFLERVVEPVLQTWKFWDLENLSGAAEASRERLAKKLETLAKSVQKEKEKRERREAKLKEEA